MKRKRSFIASFQDALSGIRAGLTRERNLRIHFVAVIAVTAAGTFLQIRPVEWCICILLFALVISLELVNTAIEAAVDLVTEERRPLAKLAKDAAAGAVLVAAGASVIIGLIIFVPYLAGLL